jgi:hypothetical protein
MGSSKLKDLKAYVRYDGSGRVVSGSLVFRKKKPKNGRWVEIPKNLCCNGNPSSTTTTTTQGGGVTPTAFVVSVWYTQGAACFTTAETTMVVYSASPVLEAGVEIYLDATLTTIVPAGWVVLKDFMSPKLKVLSGGYLEVLNCQTSFLSEFSYITTSSGTICTDQSNAAFVSFPAYSSTLCNASEVYSGSFNGYPVGSTVYIKSASQTQWAPYVIQSSYSAVRTSNCINCF